MALCKIEVSSLPRHWRYYSLKIRHWDISALRWQWKLYINVTKSYEGCQNVSNDNTTFFRTTLSVMIWYGPSSPDVRVKTRYSCSVVAMKVTLTLSYVMYNVLCIMQTVEQQGSPCYVMKNNENWKPNKTFYSCSSGRWSYTWWRCEKLWYHDIGDFPEKVRIQTRQ